MKLAQTTATGDFGTDIQNLQTALSALGDRVTALENAPKVVDTNTTYTFQTATTTDGAIKYTAVNLDGTTTSGEVQVKGWETLVSLATGRSKAFVYANKNDTQYLLDIKTKEVFKIGDLIYFTDINMSDEWVTRVLTTANSDGNFYEFSQLETQHPDLSGYLSSSDAELLYSKQTDLQALQNSINTKVQEIEGNISNKASQSDLNTLQAEVDKLEEDLNKIDVTSQITSEINKLDVNKVGGATGSYISAIEQVDGKIVATASTLPDFDKNAQDKADKALDDAKDYVESRVG